MTFLWKTRILPIFLFLSILLIPTFVLADQTENPIITLGNDLNEEQKKQILQSFGQPKAKIITITNQEEHEALDELLPPDVIGDKALSSSSVALKEKGYGINVSTNNITWISSKMYAQALTTAGITDAEVRIAAPFPVSGTAALTGIMKAFEEASDVTLGEAQKKAATEEMVLSAKLSDQKGDEEKVLQLFEQLKLELAKHKGLNEEEMSTLIDQIATQIGLSITPEEKEALISLGMKIQKLDINWDEVKVQGERLMDQAKTYLKANPETKSWVISVWEQVKQWIDAFFSNV